MSDDLTDECALALAYVVSRGEAGMPIPEGPWRYLEARGLVEPVDATGVVWRPTRRGLEIACSWPDRVGAQYLHAAIDLVALLGRGRVRWRAANRIEIVAITLPWLDRDPNRSPLTLARWREIRLRTAAELTRSMVSA